MQEYFTLLNNHFGNIYLSKTAYVNVLIGEIQEIIDPINSDLYENVPHERIVMDELKTEICETFKSASNELISKIKEYLRNNLQDNNPKTKILFWRVVPEILEYKDLGVHGYFGYTRLAIFNG